MEYKYGFGINHWMIEDTLNYLYNLKRNGIKQDLTATRLFAEYNGNPQDNYRSIHIAGTNGKGSISSYIYNILRQKNNTGLYTSPHLIDFNERIVFNRELITDEYIKKFVDNNKNYIEEMAKEYRNPTFFETTTVMAFKYFSDRHADYASVEVGLGGRLDSTNIINPEVSVIAQIGYEHYRILGCSLTSIAYEKGGIIKETKPVVLLDDKPEVVAEIKKLAAVRKSKLIRVSEYCTVKDLEYDMEKIKFTAVTPDGSYNIDAKNSGLFQVKNICTAIAAVNSLENPPDINTVERGIYESRWPGRFEIVDSHPLVIFDSAHNPPAANALVESYTKIIGKKPLLVIGMLSDKDVFSYLSVMSRLSDSVIFTTPDEPERAIPPQTLRELSGNLFKNITVIDDPVMAYEYAIKSSDYILVTGSMYLVGFLKKYIGSPAVPFI